MNSLSKYHAHYQGLSHETQRELMTLRLVPISQESLEHLMKSAGASYAKLCEHGFGVGFCGNQQCPNRANRA